MNYSSLLSTDPGQVVCENFLCRQPVEFLAIMQDAKLTAIIAMRNVRKTCIVNKSLQKVSDFHIFRSENEILYVYPLFHQALRILKIFLRYNRNMPRPVSKNNFPLYMRLLCNYTHKKRKLCNLYVTVVRRRLASGASNRFGHV